MKLHSIEKLIFEGPFSTSQEFLEIENDLLSAIKMVDWYTPGKFIINPIRKGNGVNPIKDKSSNYLREKNWRTELKLPLVNKLGVGKIDAVKETKFGKFAVEWETGNISSSHRALNKIAIGIKQSNLIGGALIIPMRSLSRFLTDRIGNYEEIVPYLDLFRHLKIENGVFQVYTVDYDGTDTQAPIIPKGKDGNSKKDSSSLF